MHSGGGMNSAGSEDRGPGGWEEHSGKIPFELTYGDDEDYSYAKKFINVTRLLSQK